MRKHLIYLLMLQNENHILAQYDIVTKIGKYVKLNL